MKTERMTEAKIKNFTPLLDDLVKQHGVIAAAVWGRIWRYAQQESGVCQASQDKIADELGINRRTVIRHIKVLLDNDYLKDYSPNLRNRPHTYGITNKAHILITIEGVTESHSSMSEGVTESHSSVTESHIHCDSVSHEETKKKQIKKQEGGVFPESLDTPKFKEAWQAWVVYRAEIKKKLTPSTQAYQLKQLAKHPEAVAIAMIEQSIEKGWQGLFELKDTPANSNGRGIVANEDGSFYG